MEILIHNEQEMLRLGQHLGSVLSADDVVYLRGELGAGKTVLVRGVARSLGYRGSVTSPTFTLMNVYDTEPPIYHFDFYRLQSRDLSDLGLEEYMEQGGIVMIEWPQVGLEALPQEALWVEIKLVDDDYERERLVEISSRGGKYADKLERLKKLVDTRH
ncbi:MAG: tRNA (adenosine(37)-N6)-threonylcarbamoyltransferase complex ATPase subunit type 1 TsaE [Syntrophomonadaceae bacterium]|nr:tRNA (adenosine(37)-N6)-threonylcarbamoyltransferase complex ATPase subunit type 1 TsaE [Syntrophomonadaceae bacterium]